MPISRVRSMTAVYIAWKMTMKPMITAIPTTTLMKAEKPGILPGVISESHSRMDMVLYFSMPGIFLMESTMRSAFFGSSART